MKKTKIWVLAGLLMLLIVIAGSVFCVLRPDYVREAVQILFGNELP